MGLGPKFLTQVGSGNIMAAWVGSSQVSLLLVRKIFLKKANFNPVRSKNLFGSGKKLPGQSQLCLLVTTDKKDARVRLWPISSTID